LPRIQFKKLTNFERERILDGKLAFGNCNVHTNASLGFDYSLKVQHNDESNICFLPLSIQDLINVCEVIKYDFDGLYGTGVLSYISDAPKQVITSRDNLYIEEQIFKYLCDQSSNKVDLSSFKINEIQGLSFYIEASDPIPVSLPDIYLDSDSYRKEVSSGLENAFIQLDSQVQLDKSAQNVSSCDGIHPLAYAVLAYARDHKTLPVNSKEDIELLWRYMVARFGLTLAKENMVKTQDGSYFERSDIWKQYDKTYCEKVFKELEELAMIGY
jgi:hypothetical protein